MMFPREHVFPNLPRDPKRRKLNVDVNVPAGAAIMAMLSRLRLRNYDYGLERNDTRGEELVRKRTREMEVTAEVPRVIVAMERFGEPSKDRPRRKTTASTMGLIVMADKLRHAGHDCNNRHTAHCGQESHSNGIGLREECSGNVREEGYGNNYLYHACYNYPVPGLIDTVIMKLKKRDIDQDFETAIGQKLVRLLLREFLPMALVSKYVRGDEALSVVAGYLHPQLLSLDDFPVQNLREKDVPAWQLHAILDRIGCDKVVRINVFNCRPDDFCFGDRHNGGSAWCRHKAIVRAKVTSTRMDLLEQIEAEGHSTLTFLKATEQLYNEQLYCYREHLQMHADRLEKLKDKIGREIVKRM